MLALGSTGKFPFFSLDERKAVLATVAELAAPLPVIANIHVAEAIGLPVMLYYFPSLRGGGGSNWRPSPRRWATAIGSR